MRSRPDSSVTFVHSVLASCIITLSFAAQAQGERTQKPVLYGQHWVAITGKPLGATAGAMTFTRGGNAVDASCYVDHVGYARLGRRNAGADL